MLIELIVLELLGEVYCVETAQSISGKHQYYYVIILSVFWATDVIMNHTAYTELSSLFPTISAPTNWIACVRRSNTNASLAQKSI